MRAAYGFSSDGRRRIARCIVLALVLWTALHAVAGDVVAQDEGDATPRAGVVVQLGDDEVREFCVDLQSSEVSGFELLQATGLALRVEDSSMGVIVCRIEDAGCADSEPCMCACQDAGDCTYWAYNVLTDGVWGYSEVGASDRVVRHGDVDGWAWGTGTETSGPVPPVRSFDEICGDGLAGEDDVAAASDNMDDGTPASESFNAMGYAAIGLVLLVIAGVWIWSRRS